MHPGYQPARRPVSGYLRGVRSDLIVRESEEGVTTLRMNDPKRLNGWTLQMLEALHAELEAAATDPETQVVILTGTGRYYCAGVNLGGSLKLGHPAALHRYIFERNKALFDRFIRFPKPILVAANGPVLGASVTSATLCDGIIASERATFSTPFAALSVPPEGCSSEVFPKLLGDAAQRIIGAEGWKPTAAEALEIGLVQWAVPHEELMPQARRIAKGWIEQGRTRTLPAGFSAQELEAINERESKTLARAFLSPPFLMGQFRFLWGKGKRQPALMFLSLAKTHPLWKRLLPAEAR